MDKVKTAPRRQFLKMAGAAGAGVTAAVASPAIAQTNPEIKWRMTTSWPKSLDTLYGGAEHIAERVAAMTDGKFQIQVFAGGEIVPGLQVLDAVQNGTVESGHTGPYYYFGKDDAFNFGSCMPFGLNTRQQEAWFRHGGGLELYNKFVSKYNVYYLPGGNTGCQMGGWFRKQIKTVDDLKGLKFRMGGFAGKVMQRVGVIPQQLAGGDIYPALEKGTLDGTEWVGPYDDEKLGFYKVAKFYHYPGWWEPTANVGAFFNKDKWAELPKHYQEILRTATYDSNTWVLNKYDVLNPPALKRLVANGAVLTPFSPEIMDTMYKAANDLYAEISAKNPAFKEMLESQRAFAKDSTLWWQVAEYTMDSYLIRYRNMQKG
ncbi:MAG: TRAP transporter substrate-binding protein [Hyphomicrobiaceae bacterium]